MQQLNYEVFSTSRQFVIKYADLRHEAAAFSNSTQHREVSVWSC